ncbi:putative uncharacterized protein DDB_G0270496 [Hibiscus syriacus]|uniref:putative uncharacterized protein DDB_G0270496 n=1 Tax=Hibiscus syriacus TaxID=106335 RepID=UPI001924F2C4|nr:putative uncharacterized protein DDB_G0270496 [Hibiscus syriacus]
MKREEEPEKNINKDQQQATTHSSQILKEKRGEKLTEEIVVIGASLRRRKAESRRHILRNLKHHKDEDVKKGQAVKNQKALWDKTLEFRFLLQKAFSCSNRLPQDPVRSSFCASDEEVNAAYSDLITPSKKNLDSLLELQEALLDKNPLIAQSSEGDGGQSSMKLSGDYKNLDMEDDEEWLRISQMNKRIATFRDKAVDKWQRKTEVTTGAAVIKNKLQAFNQNISEQVAAYMRDPTRMIKQMQQRRPTIGIFGDVTVPNCNANGEEAHPEGDPELLDDSEFYQQLLKEFFETVDPTSSETAFYALKRLQTKKRKIVDRRASKSRKIRYHVQEKIVNFMAPEPMKLPPMAPKLFENLFGLKTQ